MILYCREKSQQILQSGNHHLIPNAVQPDNNFLSIKNITGKSEGKKS